MTAVRVGLAVFPFRVEVRRWELAVPVDDSPVLFVFVGDDASWCACGTVGGREASVAARGIAPAELVLRAVPPGRVRGDVP